MFAAASSAQEITPKDSTLFSVQSLQVDGVNTIIKLSDNAVGKVTQEEMRIIARQAQAAGGGEVTIYNVSPAYPKNNVSPVSQDAEKIKPSTWYDVRVDWSVVKSNITHDNPDSAQLIISVARGATKKLTTTVTKKVTRSISWSGGVSIPSGASSELKSNITDEKSNTYTTEQTWSGPSENSPYVSRNYYFTGFKDYGEFSVDGVGWPSGDSYGPYKGTYQEPTHYIEWSRDIR
ncbi:hypothetical protein PMJ10TS2_54410 [Paenibacillus melissococcoides]